MIIKYFSRIKVSFDPFENYGKIFRIFLSKLPPSIAIDCKLLTKNSKETPYIEVTYKDKEIKRINSENLNMEDITIFFNKHSNKLRIKELCDD